MSIIVKYPGIIIFSTISIAYVSLTFLFNHFIYIDEVYINTLSGDIANTRINDLIDQRRKIQWIGYIAIPFVIIFKVLLTTICVFIFSILYAIKLKWKQIFKIVLEAEAIFLMPLLLKLLWFSLFPPQALQEVSDFAPWSLAMLASDDTPAYLKYALQTVNVFELIYWILLAIGIRSATQFSFGKSMGIVAKSYGMGLLLWIVLVSFLLVQIS